MTKNEYKALTNTQQGIIDKMSAINSYMDPSNPNGMGKRNELLSRSVNDMQKGINWMLPAVLVVAAIFSYVLIDGVYSLSQITT